MSISARSPTTRTTTSSRRASTADDENDADEKGIRLANKVGYNPDGLGVFLTKTDGAQQGKRRAQRTVRVASRHSGSDRSPRKPNQDREAGRDGHGDGALQLNITFDAKPLAEITAVASGTKGVAGGGAKTEEKKTEEKKEEPKRKGSALGWGI